MDKSAFYHVFSRTFTNSDLSTNGHLSTTATFFWQTVHMLTLVYASLQQPLSSFPKVAVCGEVKLYHLTKGGYIVVHKFVL